MKKIIAFALTLILVFSIAPSAFAASDTAMKSADTLHALGLFDGVGTDANGDPNYDLDRAPTRAEAVTMLVRLLGKESEAKSNTWAVPFTDVAEWAKPYVGYAYAHQLTSGTSATTYSGDVKITATQYLSFALRALGYSDAKGDFIWNEAWTLSDKIGMTHGEYNSKTNDAFLRSDIAVISNAALNMEINGSNLTLFDSLNNSGFPIVYCGETESKELPQINIDGKTYENIISYFRLYDFLFAGKNEIYVMSCDVENFLALAARYYSVRESENPYLNPSLFVSSTTRTDVCDENGVFTYSYKDITIKRQTVYTSRTSQHEHFEYSYNGKCFCVDDPENEGTENLWLHYNQGVKTVSYWGRTFINLQDLLGYFGLNTQLNLDYENGIVYVR